MKKKIFLVLFLATTVGLFSQEDKVWSLADCLEYAKENNLNVKSAKNSLETAEITLKQSKLNILPSVSGSASETFSAGTNVDPITSEYVSMSSWSTNFGLSAQMSLYNGNRQYNTIQQNKLLVEKNSLAVEEIKNNISLQIIEAYLRTLYYKESITLAENNLAVSEKQEQQAKVKYEIGTLSSKEYLSVVSQNAQNLYAVANAQKQYDLQLLALKQLLELQEVEKFEIEIPEIDVNNYRILPEKEAVYNTALATLPEIKSNDLQVEINERNLKIARAGYIPSLSLSGSIGTGFTGTQRGTFSDQMRRNFNQRVGVSLSVPIFSRWNNRANELKAKVNIEEAKLSQQTGNKELYNKIENTWQNAMSSINELKSAEIARTASQEAYNVAIRQFELGNMSSTDFMVEKNNYYSFELKMLQIKYTIVIYYEMLQYYLGNEIKL